jgi:hypothetical protein
MLSDPVIKPSSTTQNSFFSKDTVNDISAKSSSSAQADTFVTDTTGNNKLIDNLKIIRQSLSSATPDISTMQKAVSFLADKPQESISKLSSVQILQTKNIISQIEQQLNSTTNLPTSIIDDTVRIVETLKNTLSLTPSKTDPGTFMLPQAQNNREGIYTFNSLAEAVDHLGLSDKDQVIVDQLSSVLQKDGKIILKINGNEDGFIASILNPKTASQELQSFFKNLTSSLLQSLPAQTVESLLNTRNTISYEMIGKIDSLLVATSIQFPGERAGSSTAAAAVATQWINTVLDNETMQLNPVIHVPLTSASKLTTEFSSINESLRKTGLGDLELINEAGITEGKLNTTEKNNFLPLTIRNLGYTLESTIHNNTSGTLSPDFKAQLLTLSRKLSDIQATPSNLIARVLENTSNLEFLGKQIVSKPDQIIVPDNILSKAQDLIETTQKSLSMIPSKQLTADSTLPPDSAATGNTQQAQLIQKKTEQMLTAVLKIISPIINQQTVTPLSQDQLQQGSNLTNQLAKMQANPFISQDLKKQFSDIIDLMSNWLSRNSTSEKHLPVQTAKEHSSHLNPVIESEQMISTQPSLRQSIETSLNRLESLQLLARQVPVSEGQQQIFALPIKIGNEWTEVNLRFLKKQKSAKKKQQEPSSYSVTLNIEPKQLGAISVKMDYQQKKNLKVSMNFDNVSTKNYFQKSIDEITSALKNLGLPIQGIDMRNKKSESEEQKKTPPNVSIDLKV